MFFTQVATRIEQLNLTITFVTLFIQQRCIQSKQSAFNHSVLGPLLVDPFISEAVIFINFLLRGGVSLNPVYVTGETNWLTSHQ